MHEGRVREFHLHRGATGAEAAGRCLLGFGVATPWLRGTAFRNTMARMLDSLVASPSARLCASLGGLLLLRWFSTALRPNTPTNIPSPLHTLLPRLSAEEIKQLPYPLDALPGARDVQSPYGSIRVYEWGPEDGEKILLIHGISTPSIALADLAHKLVETGCRVMLFGRWGCFISLVSSLVILGRCQKPMFFPDARDVEETDV